MAAMEKPNRHRLRNIQRPRWMVNGFGILHLLGRSASQATRDYRVQLNLSSIEFMRTYADEHGRPRIVYAPCSSVQYAPSPLVITAGRTRICHQGCRGFVPNYRPAARAGQVRQRSTAN